MKHFFCVSSLSALLVLYAASGVMGQDQVFFNSINGVGGGYAVGLYPGTTDDVYSIGFNFTVPGGPDMQFDDGQILASLGAGSSDMTVQIYNDGGDGPGVPIDTMTVTGLTGDAAPVGFTSNSNPILAAGQQYWLVASMTNSQATGYWWTPTNSDVVTEAASLNGSPYSLAALQSGAFSLSGVAKQWQTHFNGSATIGGTGMQNAVMVFESYNSSGGVLNEFVQPLGNFDANQDVDYDFTQALAVNASSAAFSIFGTYGSEGGTHGVIMGTSQSFGDTSVSNGSTFSDIFNGASEETLYSELSSDDYTDVQTFFDQQLADDGGLSGGGSLPDIVLNGQDYQNMLLAESGSLATGGACFVPPTDYVGLGDLSGAGGLPDIMLNDQGNQAATMSAATQIGTGSLVLSTPEPGSALLLALAAPGLLLRQRRRSAASVHF